jgi:hypothetical protein
VQGLLAAGMLVKRLHDAPPIDGLTVPNTVVARWRLPCDAVLVGKVSSLGRGQP